MRIQMNNDKILKEFLEKYVTDRWINEFLEIDETYKKDKSFIDEELTLKFDKVCRQAIYLQENKLKKEIKYIYFSLLRTNIIENKGEYRIDLYDENWFLDKEECSINIDLNFIFQSLFSHRKELREKKKQYGNNIHDVDIDIIILKEIDKYHILAVEFLKGIIEKIIKAPSYEKMKKKEDIVILAGEYMDESEIIYPKKI